MAANLVKCHKLNERQHFPPSVKWMQTALTRW